MCMGKELRSFHQYSPSITGTIIRARSTNTVLVKCNETPAAVESSNSTYATFVTVASAVLKSITKWYKAHKLIENYPYSRKQIIGWCLYKCK